MTGAQGLKDSSQYAVLNANYIAKKLNDKYPVLYTGPGGLVAHECILDLRQLTDQSHVTAEDVCKRLMDFGFHAPTLAFPVPGTLMVEPTESESKEELDRFIEAMETIYDEIIEVAEGKVAVEDSVLRNAPHTVDVVSADEWDRPTAVPRQLSRFRACALTSTSLRWVVLMALAVTVTSCANAPDGGFRSGSIRSL